MQYHFDISLTIIMFQSCYLFVSLTTLTYVTSCYLNPHKNSITSLSLLLLFVTDDVTVTAEGVDTYHQVKVAGKYRYAIPLFPPQRRKDQFKMFCIPREYKRTLGVSTTDLVGRYPSINFELWNVFQIQPILPPRMLLMTCTHHNRSSDTQDMVCRL